MGKPVCRSCVHGLREHDQDAAADNGTEPTRDITGDCQEQVEPKVLSDAESGCDGWK